MLTTATAAAVIVLAGCSTPSAPNPDAGASGLVSSSTTTSATSGGSGSAAATFTSHSVAAASAATSAAGPVATESNPPGDIPDNQAFVPFTPVGAHFSVSIPEGWARQVSGGVASFTDKLNRVQISSGRVSTPPTTASVQSVDVATLGKQVPKFAMGKISTVDRSGQQAILLTYQGDSAQDSVTGKVVRDAFERYTFVHAGTRVDLTLSAPTNADNVDPWRTVSESLRWQG